MGFYENMKEACAEHDTTISVVLRELGHSTGSTGTWAAGKYPRLDIVMEIADYLHISIDELIYGKTKAASKKVELTPSQMEWLDITDHIPEDRQELCKDFLRTHMVVPEKYIGKKSV